MVGVGDLPVFLPGGGAESFGVQAPAAGVEGGVKKLLKHIFQNNIQVIEGISLLFFWI